MKSRFSAGFGVLCVLAVVFLTSACQASDASFQAHVADLRAQLADLSSTLRPEQSEAGTPARALTLRRDLETLAGTASADQFRILRVLDLEAQQLDFSLSQNDAQASARHLKNADTLLQVLAARTPHVDTPVRHGGNGGMVSKPCAFCGAKGKDYWGTLCKVCGGDGYVMAPKDSPVCAGCQGKGKDYWGTVCQGCGGTGWANANIEPGNGGGHDHHGHHGGYWSLQLCGTCTGKGKDYWGTLCKPCGGDGYVAISGEPKACAGCQGKGKDYWGTVCTGCSGTGWANTTANPAWGGHMTSTACGFCGGKGKDYWGTVCDKCGGDGYVSGPADHKQCAACGGKGKDYWGTVCAGCQGNGFARFVEMPISGK